MWPVAIIAVREIAISLYRVYWGRRGLAVPARRSAKLKTLVQSLAVGAVLMPPLTDVTWLADGLLYLGHLPGGVRRHPVRGRRRKAATTLGDRSGLVRADVPPVASARRIAGRDERAAGTGPSPADRARDPSGVDATVGFLELFYDLVFVAATMVISNTFSAAHWAWAGECAAWSSPCCGCSGSTPRCS